MYNHFSPLKQEPDYQFDDADVANAWSKLQLDLVDEIHPRVLAQLLLDAKAALRRYPQVRCAVQNQAQRTETRVALLWQTWRGRREAIEEWDVHEWVPVVHDVEEVLDPVMDLAIEQCPRLGPCLEMGPVLMPLVRNC